MKITNLTDLFLSKPINKLAFMVSSQKNCESQSVDLTFTELLNIKNILMRKNQLLKKVLGIETKAQHKNLKTKYKYKVGQFRQKNEPRAFAEYILIGHQIHCINKALSEIKDVRREFYKIQNELQ